MGPRLKIVIPVAVLLAGLAVYCMIPREPSYQRRTVSEWIMVSGTSEARNAISNIGPAALPYIIKELEAKDAAWKLKVIEWAKKQTFIPINFTPDTVRRQHAVAACRALGPRAKPAIPALGTALGYGNGEAISVLESFGREAIPVLACALTSAPACSPPYGTALALKRFGARAKDAVPQLIWTFENHTLSFPRNASAGALGTIYRDLATNDVVCEEARMAKAALLRGLKDPKLFSGAAYGLGEMGPLAIDAIPLIGQQLESLDSRNQEMALRAMQSITPDWGHYMPGRIIATTNN